MKIAVCLKRVPDTAAKIRIRSDQRGIDGADVQYVISPYDEYALEEGIAIKERLGQGEVTAVCVGPEAAQQNLRQALAVGADSAILVRHDGADLDGYQIASALAAVLREGGYRVLLFGRLATDTQAGQVGPMTARLLGMPCVTDVVKLTIQGNGAVAEREVDGAREIVETQLPAAFTAQKGLNEPRYASLKGIMAAKKKPLVEKPLPGGIEPRMTVQSLSFPPPRATGRIVGEGVAAVPELVRLLRSEAKAI